MEKTGSTIIQLLKTPLPPGISFGKPIPADRLMILAPHPDDEVLGCGGVLLHYLELKADITIIYLTDGRYGVDGMNAGARKAEARALRELLPGIRQVFWNFPDATLCKNKERAGCYLKEAIVQIKPGIIFTPWFLDHHSDHETTTLSLAEALQGIEHDVLISCYEIMSPLFGNHTVNITRQLGKKNKLIDTYAGQVKRYNIKEVIKYLNRYRAGLFRRSSIQAAECFFVIDKHALIDLVKRLYG